MYWQLIFIFYLYWLLSLDVMVLNDIIEQAAGRHSRASDRGGKFYMLNCSYKKK